MQTDTVIYADSSCRDSKAAYASVVTVTDGKTIDLLDKKEYTEILKDFTMEEMELPVGKRRVIVAKTDDVAKQHNNYGELLALVAALRIAIFSKVPQVCSDSDLMIKWWSLGHYKSRSEEHTSEL